MNVAYHIYWFTYIEPTLELCATGFLGKVIKMWMENVSLFVKKLLNPNHQVHGRPEKRMQS